MSEIPEELEPWVAKEGQGAAEVVEPLYIDYRAAEELAPYHPGFLENNDLRLRHVAEKDESGNFYVKVEPLVGKWSEEFKSVTAALRLYLKKDSLGNHYLVDDDVQGPKMGGWEVTEWRVVKNFNSNQTNVHQDLIVWRKNGLEVVSFYSWREYAPTQPDTRGILPRDVFFWGFSR